MNQLHKDIKKEIPWILYFMEIRSNGNKLQYRFLSEEEINHKLKYKSFHTVKISDEDNKIQAHTIHLFLMMIHEKGAMKKYLLNKVKSSRMNTDINRIIKRHKDVKKTFLWVKRKFQNFSPGIALEIEILPEKELNDGNEINMKYKEKIKLMLEKYNQ